MTALISTPAVDGVTRFTAFTASGYIQQRLVHSAAKTVEMQAKARNDKEILAKYEKTRAYRSSIARKAARTRKRNQNDLIDVPAETPVETPAE